MEKKQNKLEKTEELTTDINAWQIKVYIGYLGLQYVNSKCCLLITKCVIITYSINTFLNANSSKAIPHIICKLNIRKIN